MVNQFTEGNACTVFQTRSVSLLPVPHQQAVIRFDNRGEQHTAEHETDQSGSQCGRVVDYLSGSSLDQEQTHDERAQCLSERNRKVGCGYQPRRWVECGHVGRQVWRSESPAILEEKGGHYKKVLRPQTVQQNKGHGDNLHCRSRSAPAQSTIACAN